ncbi:hypothetical protein BVRB_5g102590 [Beta vulgaris subsp. vulgaris]|nr:hypothetical protein BVRB_5g102590 [Beta vulgaris subsp. vulgaris]
MLNMAVMKFTFLISVVRCFLDLLCTYCNWYMDVVSASQYFGYVLLST